jgi:hypothetical protein
VKRTAAPTAVLALAAVLAGCGPRDVQSAGALVGRWQGHVAWRDATTPIALRIEPRGDSLAARFFAPALGVDSLDAGALSFDSPRVYFAVPDSAGAIAFDGWLRRGLIVGAFSSPALHEPNASLLPQASLRREEPRRHTSPWPESLSVAAPLPHEREHGLGEWLRDRAAR